MEESVSLPVGSVLDSGVREYRIMEVLGQGGFGITYKAAGRVKIGNIEMTVSFAIKEHFMRQFNERRGIMVTVPNSSNASDVSESICAFLSEARRLNSLSLEHPGIVKVNESFRANGTAYYVMEYVEGESLRSYVEHHEGGRLSETEAVMIIRQVGESIQYLHDHRLTHLDIKPDNVLLRSDGQPVLIDFGLSKHYDKKGRATSTLKVLGTSDGYSPLEQYSGIKEFSPKADVYALAATLLFMLSGKDPVKAIDIRPASITDMLCKDVSPSIANAVLQAMSMLPDEPTASVTDFLDMLSGEAYGVGHNTKQETDASQTKLIRSLSPRKKVISSFNNWRLHNTQSMWLLMVAGALVIFLVLAFLLYSSNESISVRQQPSPVVQLTAPVQQSTTVSQTSAQPSSSVSNTSLQTFTVKGVSFNMVRVEGGTFQMGSNDSDAYSNEKPVHQVTLSTYYIGETEVTQALWEAVMGSNPSNFKGNQKPVEMVSWKDCQKFIQKLNAATGKQFHLPTEAEWEFAARGGVKSSGYQYSGSNNRDDVAWYDENSDNKTHDVKSKQANELGLYDMSGNVWEWCQDWMGDYSSSAQTNPTGPTSGSYRVFRGGSWHNYARFCRVASRSCYAPDFRIRYLGLRLALQLSLVVKSSE